MNYKKDGQWVINRAPTPVFEASLKRCLAKLSFTDEQIREVTEKPQEQTADKGKGQGKQTVKGKGKARKGGTPRPPLHKAGRGAGGKGHW